MNSLIILGVVLLGAFVVFKLFGKLLKVAVLVGIAALALVYFYGGHQIGGVTVPSFNL
ncbi:MAG: hypothetical protein ABWZ40_07310 [Caulobacterales bacterium]